MQKRRGEKTIVFEKPINILSTASVVGPKEGEGPLAAYFDTVLEDNYANEKSWEAAESKIVKQCFELALSKAGCSPKDVDYVISGDLLNQSVGSTFGIRDLNIPFFGIFGACSTMGEGMSLGAILIDGGFADKVLVGASSHFCAAEKQFRFPLELGTQRPPTASWTVTGDGSAVLSREGEGPFITAVTTGKIVDMGISDAANMGAAMAPAALDTLISHFKDMNTKPEDYDLIVTGDLGHIGRELVVRLAAEEGYILGDNYTDCGILIFDKEKQDTHAGGSGCGCSAVTFAGYLLDCMKKGSINKLLFIPTGALMSPTSTQQGESIPGIAHAVVIENRLPG